MSDNIKNLEESLGTINHQLQIATKELDGLVDTREKANKDINVTKSLVDRKSVV